jgi:Flp pilus assembly protein TadG
MIHQPAAFKRSRGLSFLGIDGAAAVEFAITAPILVVLVLGVADYGLLAADSAGLESATRAGAEVGKANPSVTAAQVTALFPSGITPTVTSVCTCIDNTWPTGAACPPGPLATPCAGKTNPFITGTPVDPRVFEYVQVTATQSVSPIVSYGTYTAAKSVNGNTTIRFQ